LFVSIQQLPYARGADGMTTADKAVEILEEPLWLILGLLQDGSGEDTPES
jgi:hypothetical protein